MKSLAKGMEDMHIDLLQGGKVSQAVAGILRPDASPVKLPVLFTNTQKASKDACRATILANLGCSEPVSKVTKSQSSTSSCSHSKKSKKRNEDSSSHNKDSKKARKEHSTAEPVKKRKVILTDDED